jgi:isoleucyl-tRNA synthetase
MTEFSAKSAVAQKEEEILKFWQDNKIFEKSLGKPSPKGEFVFYDGPPFATGLPHFGNLVPGTIKDVIPRYKTMQGYHVDRRWGWDCHGLPIENLIQKENNLKTSKDIEEFGIKAFNQKAKDSVFRYAKEWGEIIPRTGRWVDMKNPYTTMDSSFTESVWWGFKELYDKGLVYKDFKTMHLSPLLETTLSNFEVNLGYKDIKDISVTVKFELEDEPGTFVLAWTTTPWTLPANVALAVGESIDYVKVLKDDEKYIVAKNLASQIFGDDYIVEEEMTARSLIGRSYKPPFDYYARKPDLENKENAWKIYPANFVTAEDGTGIAHEAPAFGEEDYQLLKEFNLPFVQHVNINGTIKDEAIDFAGLQAKPKDDPTATDVEVLKNLAEKGLLFSKEKIEHSYPHCWRTEAPLLNYATSSWFIKVTDLKDKLIKNNNKVNWVPESVGKLRFGNWLEDAKDWAISRNRFWGTPMPVWQSKNGDTKIIGSLDELKQKTKFKNNYMLLRHGEAEHNVKRITSDDNSVSSSLTEKGKADAFELVKSLKSKKIDYIYVSPLDRTEETAEIIKKELGLNDTQVITDDRIKELQTGVNGQDVDKYRKIYKSHIEKFDRAIGDGENLVDLKTRVGDFVHDIDSKHEGKNILIVSHEYPLWMLFSVADCLSRKDSVTLKTGDNDFIQTGEVKDVEFFALPHNDEYELDFHRPYIDEVVFEEDGKTYTRISEVFDTWIDSGSMPFASNSYPKDQTRFKPGSFLSKGKRFPADFIAEGLDQTRGWFYTLLVWGTGLFGKSPYKNVVVNGLVLASDGKKMSKSLDNYPPIYDVLDKYGADAFRYFVMNSPVVKADDLRFSEKGVDEVMKKIILRLDNVVSFYELYSPESRIQLSRASTLMERNPESSNVLDKWIIERLREACEETTRSLDNYELDRGARPFLDFVDDLSAWYLRRSRDRFKSKDNKEALQTLRYVLTEFSKILAPYMPFKAEDVFQRVQITDNRRQGKSVHLEDWPTIKLVDGGVLEEMKIARDIVTLALEKRASAGIKTRQPLQKLEVKDLKLGSDFVEIIKDEVNVKEVVENSSLQDIVALDTSITDELRQEGSAREIIRAIQDLRKKMKLSPEDRILVHVEYIGKLQEVFDKYEEMIKETTKTTEFIRMDNLESDEVDINGEKIKFVLQKV